MQVNETQQEEIYIILKDDMGFITVEGCYTSKVKAERRLDVLDAEEDLCLAKIRERHPDENLGQGDVNTRAYWIVPGKTQLIR